MQHITFKNSLFPKSISVINSPPKELFFKGSTELLLKRPRLAIAGSRKVSIYGQNVTEQIIRSLAPQGVVAVSGLALGIDSITHKATLEAGEQTIAMLCQAD